MLRDVLQISIGLYTWRSFPPITYSQESKKNEIYGQVKSSDIFILIAANTLGTCENKLPIEIEAAKEKLEQDENFIFLSWSRILICFASFLQLLKYQALLLQRDI